MTVYLLFLPRALHLDAAQAGLVLAATGPGAILGSLVAARLPNRTWVLIGAALIGDSVLLLVPALHSLPALMAVNVVFGLFGQLVNVMVMAIRQTVTPYGMQGRVAATVTFAGMGLTPLGSLLGGVAADRWGLHAALLATAAGMLLSPIIMLAGFGVRCAGDLSLADRRPPGPVGADVPADRLSRRQRRCADRGGRPQR